jgi:hypothetical protein
MKQVVCHEQTHDDRRQYQNSIHALLLWGSGGLCKQIPYGDTVVVRSVALSRDDFLRAADDSYILWIGNTTVLRRADRPDAAARPGGDSRAIKPL